MREVFHLGDGDRWLFAVEYRPPAPPIGGVVLAPPFAEEMNRCRRQVAEAAQAFAEAGFLVLAIDLFGTGDSAGDFLDASWEDWTSDLEAAWAWMESKVDGPVVVWGVRAGALLALDWLRKYGRSAPLLFWQPVAEGRTALNGFLRIQTGARVVAGSGSGDGPADARTALERGESVRVGGYGLTNRITDGLGSASCLPAPAAAGPIALFEVGPNALDGVSVALTRVVEAWRAAAHEVRAATCAGPRFWMTQEIEVVPELTARSRDFLLSVTS